MPNVCWFREFVEDAMTKTRALPVFKRKITTLINDYGELNIYNNGDYNTVGDLFKQKEELIYRLSTKIKILTNEQTKIVEETVANDLLGADVAEKITMKCRPVDASKCRSYIDDIGHITMLLLSLSGRLAKLVNAIEYTIGDNSVERVIIVFFFFYFSL